MGCHGNEPCRPALPPGTASTAGARALRGVPACPVHGAPQVTCTIFSCWLAVFPSDSRDITLQAAPHSRGFAEEDKPLSAPGALLRARGS